MTVPPLRASTFQDTRPIEKYRPGAYSPESYALIVSIRQRSYLRRLVRASFTDRRPVQHDYGCGTGRALRLLQGMVREAHGYDSSYEVIEAARESGLHARLHEITSDDPSDVRMRNSSMLRFASRSASSKRPSRISTSASA